MKPEIAIMLIVIAGMGMIYSLIKILIGMELEKIARREEIIEMRERAVEVELRRTIRRLEDIEKNVNKEHV